jgi:signal transduction histidine kinase
VPTDGPKLQCDSPKRSVTPPRDAVTELVLPLPQAELAALQGTADSEGETVASLIRRVLRESRADGRGPSARTKSIRGLASGDCPGTCHWASEACRHVPLAELSSGVWEVLEEARATLAAAADEAAVCSTAVRLAVPFLGRFCEIKLPGPESARAAIWRTPGWDPAVGPVAHGVLPLAHAGCPAGTISFSGQHTLDEISFRRASRLFAATVSRALDRVAAAEIARRDFYSAALAHELGNALAPLAYGAATIRYAGLDSPVGREVYGRMDRQIAHLRSVLEGMLDLHRADHGMLLLRTQRVDLGEIAGHAADSVEPLVREKHHTLTVRVEPDARSLSADPIRLEQVLVNLLTNAVKYMAPGGQISLHAIREGGSVVVRVRDTGEGIPADLLPRVFDGFVQGQAGAGGLGIGLALVRRLVEAHGGHVGVSSDGPGTGSEFVVTLPDSPPPDSPGRAPDPVSGER